MTGQRALSVQVCLCLLLSRWPVLGAPMLFDVLQCRLLLHSSARLPCRSLVVTSRYGLLIRAQHTGRTTSGSICSCSCCPLARLPPDSSRQRCRVATTCVWLSISCVFGGGGGFCSLLTFPSRYDQSRRLAGPVFLLLLQPGKAGTCTNA